MAIFSNTITPATVTRSASNAAPKPNVRVRFIPILLWPAGAGRGQVLGGASIRALKRRERGFWPGGLVRRPHGALVAAPRHLLGALEHEALQAPALVRLGRIEIPLRVHG